MNLLNTLRHLFSPGAKSADFASAWMKGDAAEMLAPATNPYLQSTWVYAAISVKAAKLAQVPFRLVAPERRGGEQVAPPGPAADLFARPHPGLDSFAFWELVATWLDLRGEVFLVALDAEGAVTPIRPGAPIGALAVLHPDQVTEVIESHRLAGWRYAGTDTDPLAAQTLLPEEVIHLRLPNPFHPWRGLSPLSVAQLAAQVDHASALFMKGLILNNADTGLIVTSEHHLLPAQVEQILAALRERRSRAGQATRPLFLSGGVKVDKPALSAADLEFLENRKFTRQEILALFRVPETVLGFTEDANRAVAESQMLHWVLNVIAPLCRRLEAGLQPLVAALAGPRPLQGYFDLDELPEMQNARRLRVDAAATLFSLGVPLNDINRTLDLGLPAYPWGNTGARNSSSAG